MENTHTDVEVLGVTATVILNYYHKQFHYCHERIGNYLLGCMQYCVSFFPLFEVIVFYYNEIQVWFKMLQNLQIATS